MRTQPGAALKWAASLLTLGLFVGCGAGEGALKEASLPTQTRGVGVPAASMTLVPSDGRRVALIVGISDYQSEQDLPGVAADVPYLEQAFKARGFAVTVVHDGSRTTRAGLDEVLRGFLSGLTGKDTAIVYFAGHGATSGGEGPKGFLIPSDGTIATAATSGYAMDTVLTHFHQSKARQVTFVSDSCFSGLALPRLGTRGDAPPAFLQRLAAKKARVVMVAGASDQVVLDQYKGHGIYTYFFVEGLGGAADFNGDGFVRLDELQAYVSNKVPEAAAELGHTQQPYMARVGEGEMFFSTGQGAAPAAAGKPDLESLERFTRIDPASYTAGSPTNERGRNDNEAQRAFDIDYSFWAMRAEVSQGEWTAVMGNNPSRFEACGAECPVESVSWLDAAAYANQLSTKHGLESCYLLDRCTGLPGSGAYQCESARSTGPSCMGYRLPSEAEWEFMARAGTRTSVYAGGLNKVNEVAWNEENSGHEAHGDQCSEVPGCGPRPGGQKGANAWKVSDALGNVEEWTDSWYSAAPTHEPQRQGTMKVVKGGSFAQPRTHARAAYRRGSKPDHTAADRGFRLVRTVRSWRQLTE